MKMNDPLQTLYQIMSGRQPAAATVSFRESSMVFVLCIFCSDFVQFQCLVTALMLMMLSATLSSS